VSNHDATSAGQDGEDRLAELLAEYDDALAQGPADVTTFLPPGLEPAAVADAKSGKIWLTHDVATGSNPLWNSPTAHLSPDGNDLAIRYVLHPSALMDLAARRQRPNDVRDVIAIANGAKYIAARRDASVILFDPASGRELHTLRHDMGAACAAFSPDARTLATATGAGKVHLWNVATGEELTTFATDSIDPRVVRFSSDGRRLAALTFNPPAGDRADSTLRVFIWDGSEGPIGVGRTE